MLIFWMFFLPVIQSVITEVGRMFEQVDSEHICCCMNKTGDISVRGTDTQASSTTRSPLLAEVRQFDIMLFTFTPTMPSH